MSIELGFFIISLWSLIPLAIFLAYKDDTKED